MAEYGVLAVLVAEGTVGPDAVEETENHDHHQDHPPGTDQETLQAFPGMGQDAPQGRHMVGRQFHDKGNTFSLEQGVPQQEPGEHRHQDADQVEGEDHILSLNREEGSGKERVDGKPCSAGHHRRHHRSQRSFTPVFEGTGRHHCGYGAAEPDHHRDHRLSRQPYCPHQPVHDEGRSRHIARIFEQGEAEE